MKRAPRSDSDGGAPGKFRGLRHGHGLREIERDEHFGRTAVHWYCPVIFFAVVRFMEPRSFAFARLFAYTRFALSGSAAMIGAAIVSTVTEPKQVRFSFD
jgi:hypothetical protein